MKKHVIRIIGLTLFLLVALVASLGVMRGRTQEAGETSAQTELVTWWQIQSIDTMKHSRDLAREKRMDAEFGKVIQEQVRLIAASGATHIAVGTPYDEEFIPFLTKWVAAARKYGVNVWFRGNFSGWEGWFGYPAISREEHLIQTEQFIRTNPALFADGDIFESCPECENGSLGDPRDTGNPEEYREFLIEEYLTAQSAFRAIGKNDVRLVYSMNGDVARLVMNEETAKKIGSIVAVDHYLKDPQILAQELKELTHGGKIRVLLSEFGAPIPDIHGPMDERTQSEWVEKTLELVSENRKLIGVNYWVGFGGSTRLWREDTTPTVAVFTVQKYFKPKLLRGVVVNQTGQPVSGAQVEVGPKQATTAKDGSFLIPVHANQEEIRAHASGYREEVMANSTVSERVEITLTKARLDPIFLLDLLWCRLFAGCR